METGIDDAHDCANITNTPVGNIAATNVQGAINELETEKENTLTAHHTRHVTGGGDVIADAIAAGNSGLMSGADKTKIDGIEATADVTDTANVTSAGALMETTYNAQSVVIAITDDTPIALGIAASEIVGRTAGGNVDSLTATEARTVLNVEDNADVTDAVNVASSIHGVVAKTTPVDADEVGLIDTAAANVLKKLTWTNIKATLKTYFDTLYDAAGSCLPLSGGTMTGNIIVDTNKTYDLGATSYLWNEIHLKKLVGDGTSILVNENLLPDADGLFNCGGAAAKWASVHCTTLNGALSAASITGTLPVAHGGTGVTGDTYDADKVDGCDAGIGSSDVFKIPAGATGDIYFFKASITNEVQTLSGGTDGYQLTTHGLAEPTWAAASDLIWSDKYCPKCGKEFEDGEILVMYITEHNEVGDILTIPMHQSCSLGPKKTVTLKHKVFEDQYILNEDTGESVIQRVQKTIEKTVIKHKMKEGYELDTKTGKVYGKDKTTDAVMSEVLEDVEETVYEGVYEDVEYEI
jgi:hypothetical protein